MFKTSDIQPPAEITYSAYQRLHKKYQGYKLKKSSKSTIFEVNSAEYSEESKMREKLVITMT